MTQLEYITLAASSWFVVVDPAGATGSRQARSLQMSATMVSGFRIATIRGIPIRVDITFLIVLPLIAYVFGRAFIEAARLAGVPPQGLIGSPWLWGLGVAIALFVSVLIHELAHALYALRRGGQVDDITLMMIGGASRISEMPKRPRHEAIMALVGPLTSLTLGAVFFALHLAAGGTAFNVRFALFYLGILNVFLGVFNLLPAFPMDGGRILRSALTPRMGLLRATRFASQVGKVFAVLFGIWGLVTMNVLLLLIAVFVFLGADAENRAVMVRSLLGQVRVQDVMSDHLVPLSPDTTVHDAAERMLAERRLFYVVAIDGRQVGLLTLDAIAAVPPERRRLTLARDVAIQTSPVAPSEEAEKALRIMNETAAPEVAVSDRGHLVGTVSREDIVRVLKLTELEASQHGPPAQA